MTRPVLLINSNNVRPPVSPVGLEYVGHSLLAAGQAVFVLDLAFDDDWRNPLHSAILREQPFLVGLSVRNTDDCCFVSRKSFLPWIRELVAEIRKVSDAPVFLGGAGFSTMPEAVLKATQADGGVAGDGEEAFAGLAAVLSQGGDHSMLPGLAYWKDGQVLRNPRADIDLRSLPLPRRRLFDNRRYEEMGAMVGVETKRGCSQPCIFCADPVAKGRRVRPRPPSVVCEEFKDLVHQGVTWFHLCDSEFNLPAEHAKDVCRALIDGGLGDRIRWYCYCSPAPFDRELALLMKRAGCAGINFGVDSLCDEQLGRLGRAHTSADVSALVKLMHREGLPYILDLLVGGPGETSDTVRETVDRARQIDARLVGVAYGVRVYPDTAMEKSIREGRLRGLSSGVTDNLHTPVFYVSPSLNDDAGALIARLAAGDPRFMTLTVPAEAGSYNYAGDERLAEAIKGGARGAYWDILSRQVR